MRCSPGIICRNPSPLALTMHEGCNRRAGSASSLSPRRAGAPPDTELSASPPPLPTPPPHTPPQALNQHFIVFFSICPPLFAIISYSKLIIIFIDNQVLAGTSTDTLTLVNYMKKIHLLGNSWIPLNLASLEDNSFVLVAHSRGKNFTLYALHYLSQVPG